MRRQSATCRVAAESAASSPEPACQAARRKSRQRRLAAHQTVCSPPDRVSLGPRPWLACATPLGLARQALESRPSGCGTQHVSCRCRSTCTVASPSVLCWAHHLGKQRIYIAAAFVRDHSGAQGKGLGRGACPFACITRLCVGACSTGGAGGLIAGQPSSGFRSARTPAVACACDLATAREAVSLAL